MNIDDLDRITSTPAVMGGKPCLRGMRVAVETVVGLLAAGRSHQEILDAYPYLEEDDIKQCMQYAALNKRSKRGGFMYEEIGDIELSPEEDARITAMIEAADREIEERRARKAASEDRNSSH